MFFGFVGRVREEQPGRVIVFFPSFYTQNTNPILCGKVGAYFALAVAVVIGN